MRSYSSITLGRKGEHPLILKDLSRGKSIAGSGAAAVFDVSNETGLRNARNVAARNGELEGDNRITDLELEAARISHWTALQKGKTCGKKGEFLSIQYKTIDTLQHLCFDIVIYHVSGGQLASACHCSNSCRPPFQDSKISVILHINSDEFARFLLLCINQQGNPTPKEKPFSV